jgi:hypothetical protein
LPYITLSSTILGCAKEFVYLRWMARWMEIGLCTWYLCCYDPLDSEEDITTWVLWPFIPRGLHTTKRTTFQKMSKLPGPVASKIL